MESILDPMISFYRSQVQLLERELQIVEEHNKQLKRERNAARRAFDRLEDYVVDCETRLEYLRAVLNLHVDRATRNVQRDLLDEFNEVARQADVDFDELGLLFPDEEFESDNEHPVIEL